MKIPKPFARGRLYLAVHGPGGELVAERRARNIVLRQGAAIVAGLFSGSAGAVPINQVRLGFATEGATAETVALTPSDSSIPAEALGSPVSPDNFTIVLDKPNLVQVLVATVFHPTIQLPNVTEAGLFAGDKLYNQVVFEPVNLRPGQDVTFFWEIDFPFGH